MSKYANKVGYAEYRLLQVAREREYLARQQLELTGSESDEWAVIRASAESAKASAEFMAVLDQKAALAKVAP